MASVSIHAAKTHLSRLIARVAKGEEIIIRKGQQPVAKLVPIHTRAPKREPGTLRGIIRFDDSFFDPLPDDELDAWEGKNDRDPADE